MAKETGGRGKELESFTSGAGPGGTTSTPVRGGKRGGGKISFHQQLAQLTLFQAQQLLGEEGSQLIGQGTRTFDIDVERDVYLGSDILRVRIFDPDSPKENSPAVVIITRKDDRNQSLLYGCDQCDVPCLHAGAALGILLEEKMLLGLAAAPDESVPLELLTREELVARALNERQQRAVAEKMTLRSLDSETPWTDYLLTSQQSGRTYRVSLQGFGDGESYCSCPDFRTNRLGTCKHLMSAFDQVRQRFSAKQLQQPFIRHQPVVYLDYGAVHRGELVGLRVQMPTHASADIARLLKKYVDQTLTDATLVMKLIRSLESLEQEVLIYPDAENWLDRQLVQSRLQTFAAEIRQNPTEHPLRQGLLKVPLLPYQMDGIAFAVGAGRAILADDMGLGKTIQGIGVAELLAQQAGIERVLVVCPASLKSQWRDEIQRFCHRSSQLILGRSDERIAQYFNDTFFTICNYEQVMRDLTSVEQVPWDLIILDEGQRIKNWESKTSQVIRSLESRFALVLSGTPLENRLDELYTVVKFVDEHCLGPAYEFFHRHRVVDEKGKVQGYRLLDDLRERLKPILLRRTRASVMDQLPERTTSIVRITPTEEQLEVHRSQMRAVSQITRKRFLTELDLIRLQKCLLTCRMVADSTTLVDKIEPGYSTKIDRLRELLTDLAEQPDRKIVLFSEWRGMLNLIEPLCREAGLPFVRLDGQVPQKKRPAIVQEFQKNPECRLIMMTNAGSTGLNLQAANTVINVDLPWNPAVLEQRIARAHRMGQRNPVHVYLLVSEQTIEENLLETLAMKQDLTLAALDVDSEVSEVQMRGGIEELKRRLEQLLGPQPAAPVDCSQRDRVEQQALSIAERRDRVAAAGGQLIGAAFQMISELMSSPDRLAPDPQLVQQLHTGLSDTIERDPHGRPQLRLTLPDDNALTTLAQTLAQLLTPQSPRT